jgi:CheY-like chemotaxis protein
MGGAIDVESVLDAGSTFTASLPLTWVGEALAVEPAAATPVRDAVPASQVRLLAVEDNPVNQLVLKTLLQQIGVEPVVVDNGQLAVEAFEREAWDVILMDVQMPVMDGPTATRIIRAREAETGRPRTPIIALTANAMSHQIAEYLAVGMDAHVSKPIEARRLYETLAMVLDEGEAEAAA